MRKTVDVYNHSGQAVKMPVPVPCGEGMLLVFYRKFLRSGAVSSERAYFVNRGAYTACLERWNAQCPGVWRYAANEMPAGPEVQEIYSFTSPFREEAPAKFNRLRDAGFHPNWGVPPDTGGFTIVLPIEEVARVWDIFPEDSS